MSGSWHIKGVSNDESHYTVWNVWISVGVKVRVVFVYCRTWCPLICARSPPSEG